MAKINSNLQLTDAVLRTNRILKNIKGLFVIKGASIGLRLLLVPMTLNYLEPEKFGIWMTLSSIIEMMILFEFGLGNGLRNKLTASLANDDIELSNVYISTTYAITAIILIPLIAFLTVLNQFVDWSAVLNASESMSSELNELVSWMLLFYGLKLFVSLILSVSKANHMPVYGGMIELVSDIFSLVTIYFLIEYTDNSLLYLGFSKFFIISLVPLLASVYLYKTKFKNQLPSINYIEFKRTKEILSLSWKFFVIQISSIIIFSTDNIIISHLFGPENVTPYVIVFQYFNLIAIFFAIVSTPLWSAYTEAYEKDDYNWIKNTVKKMLLLWLAIILAVVIMIVVAKDVIRLWLGRELVIDMWLVIFMGVYVLVQSWNRIFSWVLNGIGEVNITVYLLIIGAVINIPISIYLAVEMDMNNAGVILGTVFSLIIFSVFGAKKAICLNKNKSVLKDL